MRFGRRRCWREAGRCETGGRERLAGRVFRDAVIVGDESHFGHADEQPGADHAGDGLQLAIERNRIGDLAELAVGDEIAAVGDVTFAVCLLADFHLVGVGR